MSIFRASWSLSAILLAVAGCLKDDTSSGSSSTGLGAATPVVWIDQSTPAGSASGDTPLLWVDAVAASAQNPFGIISTDERTYGGPDIYIAGSIHPLMTRTVAAVVVAGEEQVAARLNNFRWLALTGGGFFINPPVPVGAFYLPVSLNLRKNARAHCKHFAGFHPGPLTLSNPEGDSVSGRLSKSKIVTFASAEMVLSGAAYFNPDAAADWFIANNPSLITSGSYNYMGVGYFLGGSETAYWSVVFANNPNPVQ